MCGLNLNISPLLIFEPEVYAAGIACCHGLPAHSVFGLQANSPVEIPVVEHLGPFNRVVIDPERTIPDGCAGPTPPLVSYSLGNASMPLAPARCFKPVRTSATIVITVAPQKNQVM